MGDPPIGHTPTIATLDRFERAIELLGRCVLDADADGSLRRMLASDTLSRRNVLDRLVLGACNALVRISLDGQSPTARSLASMHETIRSAWHGISAPFVCDEEALRAVIGQLASIAESFDATDTYADPLGTIYERTLELDAAVDADSNAFALVPVRSKGRRARGAYYTPSMLVDRIIYKSIDPILRNCKSELDLLAMRVCDPACGSGRFLVAAANAIADRLATVRAQGNAVSRDEQLRALQDVIRQCVFGVDVDPVAAELCRLSLNLHARSDIDLDAQIKVGNALIGNLTSTQPTEHPAGEHVFHWHIEFADVFPSSAMHRERCGYDAVIGNPPWIAHAGRAAQPLPADTRAWLASNNPAFAGYPTTHGCFVARAASLVKQRGRLGLVLPTSVADLDGYEPTRRAHDARCCVVEPIRTFAAHEFPGVFQPCMALVSEALAGGAPGPGRAWPIERTDLDADDHALLAKLDALPKLPPACFGERGLQTDASRRKKLLGAHDPRAHDALPVRDGESVRAFHLRPVASWIAPEDVDRLGIDRERYTSVRVVIRQTARYPIAALHDGSVFRNSLLAAFPRSPWTAHALVAYLNALPIRWFHFNRYRDAREGMPQVKIGHLRALPAPTTLEPRDIAALERESRRLGAIEGDPTDAEREPLDTLVSGLLGLGLDERLLMNAWWSRRPA